MKRLGLAHLHQHSEFSRLDSAMQIREFAEAGASFVAQAITDHGNVDGALKYQRACAETGTVPLFGCELYIGVEGEQKERLHLTVLAKSRTGFTSICRGLSLANLHHARRGTGEVPWAEILKLREVVVLSGCASSPVWKLEGGDEYAVQLAEAFGDDFYFEVQPLDDLATQQRINRQAARMATQGGVKPVVTCDAHFRCPEDRELHEVVLAVGQKPFRRWDDPERWRFDSELNYPMEPNEARERLVKCGLPGSVAEASIQTTLEIAEKCGGWTLEPLPIQLPGEDDADMRLIHTAESGLAKLGKGNDPKYIDRLATELGVFLEAPGIPAYLLLVSEIVGWAKSSGIAVGPGRGSAAGSLVVRALGITGVDPLEHGLSYERFYAPGRKAAGLPDIDVDFAHHSRGVVESYLIGRFGADRVAHVSTYGTVGARQALRDVARVFDVPLEDVEAVSKFVNDRPDQENPVGLAELFAEKGPGAWFAKAYPRVAGLAKRYEGRVRQSGTHAGGFVVGSGPLTDGRQCVLYERDGVRLVNWDKDDLEHFGLIKLDLLGLSALSVLDETARSVGKTYGELFETIPTDAPTVYAEIAAGRMAGAFQVGTHGMKKLCQAMRVKSLPDLTLANAVFRPGAIEQGILDEIALVVRGDDDPPDVHPKLAPILSDSYGFIVYQEQVMRACVELAGWTWAEADALRKVIGKSKGREAVREFGAKFVDGCARLRTMTREEAVELWKSLEGWGRYGFNKAHALSYALVAYQTLWAKLHYPAAFLAAALNHGTGDTREEQRDALMDEARRLRIEAHPPDVNVSLEGARELGGDIQLGLLEIDGIGEVAAGEILRARGSGKFRDLDDFLARVDRRKLHVGIIERLAEAGAFASFGIEGKGGGLRGRPTPGTLRHVSKSLLTGLRKETRACTRCDLRKKCRAPVPVTPGDTNVLIVGEAPGELEDRRGRGFVGASGLYLREKLSEAGFDPQDAHFANSICCRPVDNKFPDFSYIDGCPWLKETIKLLKPAVILALGNKPLYAFTGQRSGISKLAGTRKKLADGTVIVFGSHPASVLYHPEAEADFKRGIEKFVRTVEESL
jgi:DNA polymerase-3 subunit alpha